MTSELVPNFLVAVPQLVDRTFNRTVILMLEHGEQGALGLVINRPGDVSLWDVAQLQNVEPRPVMKEFPSFVGGPVQPDRGFVLHTRADIEESVEIFDGLRVSGSTETLAELLAGPLEAFRLILGYAGWSAGQLEKELQEGSWLVTQGNVRHVLTTPPKMAWDAVFKDMGIDPGTLIQGGGLH